MFTIGDGSFLQCCVLRKLLRYHLLKKVHIQLDIIVLKYSPHRDMCQVEATRLIRHGNSTCAFLYPPRDITFFMVEGIACFDDAERDAGGSRAAVT
jgi:hypothetical protein